ncbi:MAG: 50S ribosomal protein L6 [Saccharospirillaceae bacterium]|nr:50S ribosomal protein L6 [Saccharospirillaceae bacterium]
MSRIAKAPVNVPAGVVINIDGQTVKAKGPKGNLEIVLNTSVTIAQEDNQLKLAPISGSKNDVAQAGTARSLVSNLVAGVTEGFSKRLLLQGVGYRAKADAKSVNLTLGFSHPVDYVLPEGIKAETPTITEIVISGADKQKVGQVAAEIRAFRPPEPYKGKGVRYADEYVRRKEAKKK